MGNGISVNAPPGQLPQGAGREAMARPVIRAESHRDGCAGIAHVDWLAFTVRPPDGEGPTWLREFLHFGVGIPLEQWFAKNRGWSGYDHCIQLGAQPPMGLIAHGGQHQKGTLHVELNAHACAKVPDWGDVRGWLEVSSAVITRIDLAHDDLTGKVVNIDVVRAWYAAGGFTGSGRPPSVRLIDDYDSGEGKTFYVGKRGHGKMVRCYEKGRQLGDRNSPWFRVEVEVRNKNRVIPFDALTRPGCYFVGAYPCLEQLGDTPARIKTSQRAAKISYERMERWVREAAGPALHVMAGAHEGDATAVLERVIRRRIPKRLAGYSEAERRRVRDAEE